MKKYTKDQMLTYISWINEGKPKNEFAWDIRVNSNGDVKDTTARDWYKRAIGINKLMLKGMTYEEAESKYATDLWNNRKKRESKHNT